MNLRRIFVSAVVRRVAYVVVSALIAVVLALVGGKAAAHPGGHSDRQEAYQHCMSYTGDNPGPPWVPSDRQCRLAASGTAYELWFFNNHPSNNDYFKRTAAFSWSVECLDDGIWDDATNSCGRCSDKPALGAGAWAGVNADGQMCMDECVFEGGAGGAGVGVCMAVVIDGTNYERCTSWGPTGDKCGVGVGNGSLAPPDSDGDGTSDGNDGSPNNPGSGGGGGEGGLGQPEDGSSACGGPGQPACAEDGSNEGSGKGNTSGGGGNCQMPPSSTGDAILAQIAYQAWATRCAVEGLGEGGSGSGPGTGDGEGAKEGTLKGIKDWLDGNGEGVPDADDPWMDGLPGEPSDWNMGLGGGSCPAPVSASIELGGISAPIEFSFQPMCDLAGLLNTLFKALGALIAAYIIAGVRR